MKIKFIGFNKPEPDNLRLTQQREALFELEDGSEISVYVDSWTLHWPTTDGAIKRYLRARISDEIKRHQIKEQIAKVIGAVGTILDVEIEEDDD